MFDFIWNTASLHLLHEGNKVHPAQSYNKHRFEHVESRILNGSTHGEASKQTQSQDILRSKTRHLFNKANTEEIIDSEHSSSAETLDNFLGDIAAVPQLSRLDTVSSKSEEEEPEDDLLASWQDTYGGSDYITVEATASQSNSAASSHSHRPHSRKSFKSQLNTSGTSGKAPASRNG